jgi:Putative auto-transporter adhesin, head GIN domain
MPPSLWKQFIKQKIKIMKQLLFSFLLLAAVSFTACSQNSYSKYNGKTWEQVSGSGKMISLNPAVETFSNIEVKHLNAKVVIETGGDEYAVTVSIDDNLAGFFRSKVVDNTLQLSFDLSGGKYDRWLSDNNTVITIKAPAIVSLINSGNTGLQINIPSQPSFSLQSDGNPNIILKGKVDELVLESKGNADIKAGNMLAQKITISSSGNADIEVNAKEVVEKSVNGNNDINNLFYKTKEERADETTYKKTSLELISFRLKNNSLAPAKIALISYRPDEKGNGTNIFTLISLGTKRFSFPEGTKIYLATSDQVNLVMSGAKITDQPAFLTVKKDDSNKVFDIK